MARMDRINQLFHRVERLAAAQKVAPGTLVRRVTNNFRSYERMKAKAASLAADAERLEKYLDAAEGAALHRHGEALAGRQGRRLG